MKTVLWSALVLLLVSVGCTDDPVDPVDGVDLDTDTDGDTDGDTDSDTDGDTDSDSDTDTDRDTDTDTDMDTDVDTDTGSDTAFVPETCAEADAEICTNQIGTHCGYTYELWRDAAGGCMTLKEGGNFYMGWGAGNNILARKGLRPGTGNEIVQYQAQYSADGVSFLGIYGWMQNVPGTYNLVEYYIVDAWGTGYTPGNGDDKIDLGTVESDGGTYTLSRTTRHNKPSIVGDTTFYQYWSVRQSPRTSGTITVANHFDAWSNAGQGLGDLYEVSFVVEGFNSTGSGDVQMTMTPK